MEKTEKIKPEKKRQTINHGAMEKCRAVLAVWTERRKPAEICREMQIPWMVLAQWQKRAMEGMLQALENRVNLSKGEALSPRLQALLQNRQRSVTATKLTSRLDQINKLASPPSLPAKTE